MGRPQESFNKKELEKKRVQKRKEKLERMEERKANAQKGASLDDMLAYVDEDGNLTSTPPDPTKKKAIKLEDVVLGSRNLESADTTPAVRKGKVAFFNTSKGFGFIKDAANGESVFVHSNGLIDSVKDNDVVTFEVEKGHKGLNAIKVRLAK